LTSGSLVLCLPGMDELPLFGAIDTMSCPRSDYGALRCAVPVVGRLQRHIGADLSPYLLYQTSSLGICFFFFIMGKLDAQNSRSE
jgi:hypothetical protein